MKCTEAIKQYGKICKRLCNSYNENRGMALCMRTVTQGIDAMCTWEEELAREAKYGRKTK